MGPVERRCWLAAPGSALAICMRAFARPRAHDPVVESGPHAFALVGQGGSFASLRPVCCASRRCGRDVRHERLGPHWTGWWLRRGEGSQGVGAICLGRDWLRRCRFTSARSDLRSVRRRGWCGCVGSSKLGESRIVVSTGGAWENVVGACGGCVSTPFGEGGGHGSSGMATAGKTTNGRGDGPGRMAPPPCGDRIQMNGAYRHPALDARGVVCIAEAARITRDRPARPLNAPSLLLFRRWRS